jgi:hypothetical protein
MNEGRASDGPTPDDFAAADSLPRPASPVGFAVAGLICTITGCGGPARSCGWCAVHCNAIHRHRPEAVERSAVWCPRGDHPLRPGAYTRCLECHRLNERERRARLAALRPPRPPRVVQTRDEFIAEANAALERAKAWVASR